MFIVDVGLEDGFTCLSIYLIALVNLTIRSLYKSKFVDFCIYTKRTDQTDIRTFRRFDRTKAPVVGIVNVANLETGTLTAQTARTQGRKTTLVRNFSKRIGLVHELAERIRTEECIDDTGNRLCVNQVSGLEHLVVTDVHALADGTAHAGQTDGELVGELLADSAYATV